MRGIPSVDKTERNGEIDVLKIGRNQCDEID
jgi:hypothetical protein